MASNDIDLLTYARRARTVGWSSIPVNQDKQPDIPKVVPFRDVLPSDLELERFFGLNKKQTTVALAVLVDGNKLAIDTDGDGEKIFITKVPPRLKPELKKKVERTTHTKSPHGCHFLGKTNGGNDKIEKKEHTWKFVHGDGKGHDEIKIRLYGFYTIECGKGYEEVIAIENGQTFTDDEIDELIRITNDVAKECSAIKTITDRIRPYYISGNRDEINFSLSGYLHKGHVPEQFIIDIVDPLIDRNSSVEPRKTINVIKRTCKKPRDSDQVSGYKRLLAAVSDNHEVVMEIQQVLFNISDGEYFSQAGSNIGDAAAGFRDGNGNNKETWAEKKARKAKENAAKSDYIGSLISEYNIKTLSDTREMLYYDVNRGIYVKNGDIVLEARIESDNPYSENLEVNEYLGHVRRRTFTHREEFDPDIEWIATANCMLNVRTGETADFHPSYMCTTWIPAEYPRDCALGNLADFFRLVEEGDKTICPIPRPEKIMKFLHEIMSDKDVEIILDYLAYCLWRDYRFNIWILLNGKGNNGKSTLLKLLIRFLGRQNMSSESLDRLVNNRFAPANLYRKLINVDADLSDKTLKGNTGILKKLTGGDESEAEEKYKKAFSFVNYAKLIFSCNTIPETDDETDAFFRRLVIINFTTQFFDDKEDPTLIDKLCTEEEFSGLLLVLLDRLPRVLEKGLRPTSNRGISETYEKYVRGSNTVQYFKEKAIIDTDGKAHFVSKGDVYSAYVLFCKVSGVTVESSNSFSIAFSNLGYSYKKKEDYTCTGMISPVRIEAYRQYSTDSSKGLSGWIHLQNIKKEVLDMRKKEFVPCPYYAQLNVGKTVKHSIFNYSNFQLFLRINPSSYTALQPRKLLILDEGHEIENEAIKHVSISINAKEIGSFISPTIIHHCPYGYNDSIKDKWIPWLENLADRIAGTAPDYKSKEIQQDASDYIEKIKRAVDYMKANPDNWIISEIQRGSHPKRRKKSKKSELGLDTLWGQSGKTQENKLSINRV